MTCHCCQGEAKRFGFYKNRNRSVQRYRCCRCGKCFAEQHPLDGVRIETKQAAQIVAMLCEGVGVRAISRLTGISKQTVLNVLVTAGEHCARLLDAKVRNVKVDQCEVDELYSFVRTRPDNTAPDDFEHGEFFLYLALDRDSKIIISHLVARRRGDKARLFLHDLKDRISNRFQLSTDGWAGYAGWNGGVHSVFGQNVDYGSEVKQFGNLVSRLSTNSRVPRRFNPIVCKWVRRIPHIGEPDPKQINTSRAERLNLSVRLFNRRFTRLTLGYSKTLENHRAAAALFIAHYNFVRVHSSIKQTPAQKAGVTNHVWTVQELISATI